MALIGGSAAYIYLGVISVRSFASFVQWSPYSPFYRTCPPKGELTLKLVEPSESTHPQIRAHLEVKGKRVVVLHLTNASDTPAAVCRFNVPEKGRLANDVFTVSNGKMQADFQGEEKGPACEKSDYTQLAPGTTLTYEIDLGDWYDLGWLGKHRVWYQTELDDPIDHRRPSRVVSNEVVLD
jgi:hypothetical protein